MNNIIIKFIQGFQTKYLRTFLRLNLDFPAAQIEVKKSYFSK